MLRSIVSVSASLLVWMAVATLVNRALGAAWPAYALATPAMAFTLPMMIARLLMGAVATLAAGGAAQAAGQRRWLALVTGCLLLVFFLPVHVQLWQRFPLWYHLTFLGSLVPLAVAGGRVARTRVPSV